MCFIIKRYTNLCLYFFTFTFTIRHRRTCTCLQACARCMCEQLFIGCVYVHVYSIKYHDITQTAHRVLEYPLTYSESEKVVSTHLSKCVTCFILLMSAPPITGPPTQPCRGQTVNALCHLSSSSVTLYGGPVSFRLVKATPCLLASTLGNF